jgi:hypothetical protein
MALRERSPPIPKISLSESRRQSKAATARACERGLRYAGYPLVFPQSVSVRVIQTSPAD